MDTDKKAETKTPSDVAEGGSFFIINRDDGMSRANQI
jgi:hypothetical protein